MIRLVLATLILDVSTTFSLIVYSSAKPDTSYCRVYKLFDVSVINVYAYSLGSLGLKLTLRLQEVFGATRRDSPLIENLRLVF